MPDTESYYVGLNVAAFSIPVVNLGETAVPEFHQQISNLPIRLDMMYEQVQTTVDNILRQVCSRLSTEMRAVRKHNQQLER